MYQPPKVKPLCPPEKPPRFEDVAYAEVRLDDGSSYTLKMDIYQSEQQTEPGPCVVYYFGGGLMWGEYKQRTQKAVYCRDLVRLTDRGLTVVCPDYRLASQAVLPAAVHDAKGAIRFLKANGARFHIDPERIGVFGNSAGGLLAGMVAMSSDCAEMEGDVGGNLAYSSSVKAACLYYSLADLSDALLDAATSFEGPAKDLIGTEIENLGNDKTNLIPALIVGYQGAGRTVPKLAAVLSRGDPSDPDWRYIELMRRCSPISYSSEKNPPIALFHGARDSIAPIAQSEKLYRALVAAGADATYLSYSNGGHGPSLGEQVDHFAYQFLLDRI